MSHASVEGADFSGADVLMANLHAIRGDKETIWAGANLAAAKPTDQGRLAAEGWLRPGK